MAGRVRLTENEDGTFVWDAAPLLELLTEEDLKLLLRDPEAVRAWLRRQHQLPETERPASLPGDLRSPRDLCDLLLNIPLFVSVMLQIVPSYRQIFECGYEPEADIPTKAVLRFVFSNIGWILLANADWIDNDQLFHTRLGVDRELAQRRVSHCRMLLKQFCDDPATRAEHDRLTQSEMPDSWQLRPFVFRSAV